MAGRCRQAALGVRATPLRMPIKGDHRSPRALATRRPSSPVRSTAARRPPRRRADAAGRRPIRRPGAQSEQLEATRGPASPSCSSSTSSCHLTLTGAPPVRGIRDRAELPATDHPAPRASRFRSSWPPPTAGEHPLMLPFASATSCVTQSNL